MGSSPACSSYFSSYVWVLHLSELTNLLILYHLNFSSVHKKKSLSVFPLSGMHPFQKDLRKIELYSITKFCVLLALHLSFAHEPGYIYFNIQLYVYFMVVTNRLLSPRIIVYIDASHYILCLIIICIFHCYFAIMLREQRITLYGLTRRSTLFLLPTVEHSFMWKYLIHK